MGRKTGHLEFLFFTELRGEIQLWNPEREREFYRKKTEIGQALGLAQRRPGTAWATVRSQLHPWHLVLPMASLSCQKPEPTVPTA